MWVYNSSTDVAAFIWQRYSSAKLSYVKASQCRFESIYPSCLGIEGNPLHGHSPKTQSVILKLCNASSTGIFHWNVQALSVEESACSSKRFTILVVNEQQWKQVEDSAF